MTAAFRSQMDYAVNFQNRLSDIGDATMRQRVLFMMMLAKGRILKPEGGEFLEWDVHMRQPNVRPWNGVGAPSYSEPDSLRTPRLDWASYHYGLSLTRHQLQRNKGKTAFVNLMQRTIEDIEETFTNRWPELFFQDADNPNTEGDELPMAGMYTWLGKYSTSNAASAQGYQGKVRLVSGTYASYDMDLGLESADWKGDDGSSVVLTSDTAANVVAGESWWPEGRGDAAYDWFHPLVVNSSTARWGDNPGFNATWCTRILDFALMYSRRVGGVNTNKVDLILCGTSSLLVIQERFENSQYTLAQIIPNDPLGGNGKGVWSGQGVAYGQPIYQYQGTYMTDAYDIPYRTDLIGINLNRFAYKPVTAYSQTSSRVPIMEPYESEFPGGGGRMWGGFTYGQCFTQTPRASFLIKELGDD